MVTRIYCPEGFVSFKDTVTARQNIDNSYLQELLCNKIIEGEDGELDENAICSDGEYQIYEQDTDDDDSHLF